jgi:CRP/FNR family transcriptional regulator, anaerobic regulatory protein
MLLSDSPDLHAAGGIRPAVTRPPCAACRFRDHNLCGAVFADIGRDRLQQHTAAARHNLYRAGEASEGIQVVCEGWAVRFLQLPNGKRQILSVIMPGDLISASAVFDRQFAFSVQALTSVRYAVFPYAMLRSRLRDDPALLDTWLRLAAAEHRDADRRLVDLGQRTAQERVVNLIVQIMLRAEQRGDLLDGEFALPMSQQQIADFTGLTPVHTCRVLSALRKAGVCEVAHGAVKVLDRAELQRLAALR